ncbi:hypothetical protein [Pseudonocardia sp. GCM10023141]|uniref:hypothetical protein n=1 Tax=Pseudonocardia sp. GCM10023141 TaxID=3252653 RepID=UPI00360D0FA5
MAKDVQPNRAFAAALAESGLSHKRFALNVRGLAQSRGGVVYSDHGSVKRWLDGVQPKPETAHYIAAAMSDALRRAITPLTLGFTATLAEEHPEARPVRLDVEYPQDANIATTALRSVAGADLDDASPEQLRTWDIHAAPGVISGYLFGDGRSELVDAPSDGEAIDATAIRLTTARLMDLDFHVGGGHTRELLLYYFRSQVLPMFDALPRGAHRQELFVATAELAQMLGWSAYDAGRHGAAQRYFVHALRLAREADDFLLGARLLSNLSHQANYLGHFTHAAQLARAAQSAAARSPSSTTVSMLLSMEARALASLGDHRSCAAVLARADSAMDNSNPGADPEWISYFDRAELAGEAAHCFRDLRRPEETRRFAALAVAPADTPPRTRAFINMVTAMGALTEGSLDEAVQTARHAITLAGALQSSRYRHYVKEFVQVATSLHPRDPDVLELVTFAAPIIGSPKKSA